MSFGQNLQFLRKMHKGMTQEELAEKVNVSRQTVSKWELDLAFPELEKAIELCKIFSCSLDELIRESLNFDSKAYSNIRIEKLPSLKFVWHAVISKTPEDDAINHVREWALSCGIESPEIIGWDFPYISQEQINIYHMHGYAAACIVPKDFNKECQEIVMQGSQQYAVITIKNPFEAPFTIIPNAYKTLMRYMEVNGLKHKENKEIIPCFEKTYDKDGVTYMDVYISIES